jgi:hypothetical protein
MTDDDVVQFAHAMLALAETFNEPLTQVRQEAYFRALCDLSIDDVQYAVAAAIRTGRYFPRPVELRECVIGSPEQLAEERWGEVSRQVARVGYTGTPSFTDPLVLRAIERLWGSWMNLCQTLPGSGPELVGWIKQFKAVYATLLQQDRQGPAPTRAALPAALGARVIDIITRQSMPAAPPLHTTPDGTPLEQRDSPGAGPDMADEDLHRYDDLYDDDEEDL